MKKIIVLILVFALSGNLIVRAQSRFPIKTTSVWRINYEFPRYEWTTHASGDEEYKYFIGGDTIISGKNYFKLLKSGVLYLETPFIIRNKYIGAIRDSENKFYFVANKSDAETLLYDFDAGVGGYIADKDFALRQISTIEVLPSGRKKYMFDFITVHCGSANTVIEGIGWLGGLLEGNSCSGHPGVRGSYLVCYSEDGTAKFESDIALMYDLSCTDPITSLSSILKQDLKFSLSSSVLKVYSSNNSAPIEFVEIYNVLGNKVLEEKVNSLQEYITNIAFLERGLYLLKVSGNGQNNVFKFIINK
ncbi:MAG: T9SS type A sorting domain-containing protein [Bacteroidota bacterium]|nr:T9SS type A sorting domain-containing protein [Bacteroidota bacterium]